MRRRQLPLFFVFGCVLLVTLSPFEKENNTTKWNRKELKIARSEYFFNKLKDPGTNKIPPNVRVKELMFSDQMKNNVHQARTEKVLASGHTWNELGPLDVGGRTRAIGIDFRNSDVVIAAGVSGGIWKTTDGGTTWASKLPQGSHLAISYIAQDPNNPDTWYASMGEGTAGGSASGKGNGGNYLGIGLYKSLDNGESWDLITYDEINSSTYQKSATPNLEIASFLLSPFQLTSKIVIHDNNGQSDIYLCSQYFGIFKSEDGGDSFVQFGSFLTNNEAPTYVDLIIDSSDVMTVWTGPTDSGNNGFFRSFDGGNVFFEITPPSYPVLADFARTVLAYAPSKPTIIYSFTYDGDNDHLLYAFNLDSLDSLGGGTFSVFNRSSSLVDFTGDFGGEFTTQAGYDMTLGVHPEDENLVILGYTNLVRSNDGFESPITQDKLFSWIGGYDNPLNPFNGTHHADQHSLVFDPNDPDVVWAGHDGGISRTGDITAETISWESKNNGYNVTQYYTVSIGRALNNNDIIGGTQDNGTPFFDISGFQNSLVPSLGDVSSGDGAFCFVGENITYTSAQEGAVLVGLGSDIGDYQGYFERTDLSLLFIHPFAVDPNDEGTLYYPDAQSGLISRNTRFLDALVQSSTALVENNWEDFNLDKSRSITALKVTDLSPSHRLYFGGLDGSTPYIGYLDSANTSNGTGFVYHNLTSADADSYLADIAINPTDGNEILLVYSNYNINSLFHSPDAGATVVAVEGNLGTDDDRAFEGFTGPSIRAAEIVTLGDSLKEYFVATSIGVYKTDVLEGSSTTWTLATDLLENTVTEDLDFRPSDGTIIAGTHGRGMFIGQVDGANLPPVSEDDTFVVNENSVAGTVVGTLDASDPNGDVLSFEITSGNIDSAFSISSAGILSVATSEALDYESDSVFALTVEISDADLTISVAISVLLSNVNEAPVMEDFNFSIEENSAAGTEVGVLTASDPEEDILTFTISSGNSDEAFSLDETTGVITVNDQEKLDFEETESFSLVVRVSDGLLFSEAALVIDLIDVEDPLSLEESIELKVFPNPASDLLTISFSLESSEAVELALTDMTGRLIRKVDHRYTNTILEKWDLKPLRPGHYILQIRSKSRFLTEKILIIH